MLHETTLFTLSIANKEAIRTDIAASGSTRLTFLPKSALAINALSVQAKEALFALLALESIITLLTVDIDII